MSPTTSVSPFRSKRSSSGNIRLVNKQAPPAQRLGFFNVHKIQALIFVTKMIADLVAEIADRDDYTIKAKGLNLA